MNHTLNKATHEETRTNLSKALDLANNGREPEALSLLKNDICLQVMVSGGFSASGVNEMDFIRAAATATKQQDIIPTVDRSNIERIAAHFHTQILAL